MMDDRFDFLFIKISSYEDFQEENAKYQGEIFDLLNYFKLFLNPVNEEKSYSKVFENFSRSNFFNNLLWLYRWMVSSSYKEFCEEHINILFDFLNVIRVPDFSARQVNWAAVFLKKESFISVEEFWEDTIMRKVNQMTLRNLTINQYQTLWLMYHIGLKQLFRDPGPGEEPLPQVTGIMETVLTCYINLIKECPELEEIFGVTIEKDMFRIHELYEEKESG